MKKKEPTEFYHLFIEKQPKARNPKLHYSLDDAESELGSTDSMLTDKYLLQDEVQGSGSSEDDKGKTRVLPCSRRVFDMF